MPGALCFITWVSNQPIEIKIKYYLGAMQVCCNLLPGFNTRFFIAAKDIKEFQAKFIS